MTRLMYMYVVLEVHGKLFHKNMHVICFSSADVKKTIQWITSYHENVINHNT